MQSIDQQLNPCVNDFEYSEQVNDLGVHSVFSAGHLSFFPPVSDQIEDSLDLL